MLFHRLFRIQHLIKLSTVMLWKTLKIKGEIFSVFRNIGAVLVITQTTDKMFDYIHECQLHCGGHRRSPKSQSIIIIVHYIQLAAIVCYWSRPKTTKVKPSLVIKTSFLLTVYISIWTVMLAQDIFRLYNSKMRIVWALLYL